MQQKRANKKWTINETLRLQREYELLGMNVTQIASVHERSADAIAHRLEHEGFIESRTDARGYKELDIVLSTDDMVSDLSGHDEEDTSHDVVALNERINSLVARVEKMEQTVEETNASIALMLMSKNRYALR
jgi:flagellar motility protein MotE (MotC chaperone)